MKLIIELDGGQHIDRVSCDDCRTAALQATGYRVVRYWNDDVLLRVGDVLNDVLRALAVVGSNSNRKGTPPQPSPSLREREGADSNNKCEGNHSNHSNHNAVSTDTADAIGASGSGIQYDDEDDDQ